MKRTKFALLIFLVSFVLYVLTLAPSLGTGPGAVWVVNSLASGLPQAPGNILYLLVAWFFATFFSSVVVPLLSAGINVIYSLSGYAVFARVEPATGVNLVSALSAAANAGLVFSLLDRLAEHLSSSRRSDSGYPGTVRWILAAGVLFLATLPSIWASAVTAGPESFNLFLVVFSFWLLVRVEERSPSSDVLIMIWAYLAGLAFSQQYVFLLEATLLAAFLVCGTELGRRFKANLGMLIFLFFLGLTVYLYLWVRPVIDPGLGQPVVLFSKDFWRYLFNSDSLRGSLPRNANFFLYQFPLFLGYLKNQAGHWISVAVVLVIFLYGIIRLLKGERKLGLLGLALLAFGLLSVLWLADPKLGLEQAWDNFPDPTRHEPTHIDRVFIFTYLIFGIFTVIGAVFLKIDLGQFFKSLAKRMEFKSGKFEKLTGYSVTALLVIFQLGFVPFRWQKADMSGFYVVRDLAENMLRGVEPESILIVRSDDEYYPVTYINKFLIKDSERSIVNFRQLSDKSYLKSLKNASPPVLLTYDDTGINRLGPVKLIKRETFQAGNLKVTYPENTVFLIRDMAILDILRANGFSRPVYFSRRLGLENMLGLYDYFAFQGLVIRLFEEDPLATEDSLNFWRQGANLPAVDIKRTNELLWRDHIYRTSLGDIKLAREDLKRPLLAYARSHLMLGEAFLSRKDASSASLNFRQCEFFDPNYSEMLFTFAARMTNAGEYEETKNFAGRYFKAHPVDPLKWAGLAKIALENTDSIPATEFLLEAIKADPDFQLGFQKLIRLFDSMGRKTMVSAFLSRWLSRHPDDQETRKLWEEYSTTETLPPDFPE